MSLPVTKYSNLARKDYNRYKAVGKGLVSSAEMTDAGRIAMSFDLRKPLADFPPGYAEAVQEHGIDRTNFAAAPAMNIVIMIVGSRGTLRAAIDHRAKPADISRSLGKGTCSLLSSSDMRSRSTDIGCA